MKFSKEFTAILAENGYKETESGYDWYNDQFNLDCTGENVELWLRNTDNPRMSPEMLFSLQTYRLTESQLRNALIAFGALVEKPVKPTFEQLADVCRPDPTGKIAYNEAQDKLNDLYYHTEQKS